MGTLLILMDKLIYTSVAAEYNKFSFPELII